jgi:hypothetical protein
MKKLFINIILIIANIFKSISYYLDLYMNSINNNDVKLTNFELRDNNRSLSF